MATSPYVDFDNEINAGVLHYFASIRNMPRVQAAKTALAPNQADDPYMKLGTHPELVERLWNELTAKLPEDCCCVVCQTPVLVNFKAGIIFAFAGGTGAYAFRLPLLERTKAIRAGAKTAQHYPAYDNLGIKASSLDLSQLGPEWVFGGWFEDEEDWCLSAYLFADEINL